MEIKTLTLISIITPSLNSALFIEQAIQSILQQDYPNFEHWIIDGGSTDGTLGVLKKYPHLKIISEPDQGIYDALNKGILKVSGDYIGFLNSDDQYSKNALNIISELFSSDEKIDIIWGRADVIKMDSNANEQTIKNYSPPDIYKILQHLIYDLPIFNACFFRKRVFEHVGFFLPLLKIAGDREFLLRAALQGMKFLPIDKTTYQYFSHDSSLTFSGKPEVVEQWNLEHCSVAEYYLKTRIIDTQSKKTYREFHSKSTLSLIKISFTRRDYSKLINYFICGCKINPGIPLLLLKRIFRTIGISSRKN